MSGERAGGQWWWRSWVTVAPVAVAVALLGCGGARQDPDAGLGGPDDAVATGDAIPDGGGAADGSETDGGIDGADAGASDPGLLLVVPVLPGVSASAAEPLTGARLEIPAEAATEATEVSLWRVDAAAGLPLDLGVAELTAGAAVGVAVRVVITPPTELPGATLWLPLPHSGTLGSLLPAVTLDGDTWRAVPRADGSVVTGPYDETAGWHVRVPLEEHASIAGAWVDGAVVSCVGTRTLGCGDSDGDGALDVVDNCPATSNPEQLDRDGDGYGDACDLCPDTADEQQDGNGDGIGDACDPCALPDGTPRVCDDGDPCNGTESCDPARGCVSTGGSSCDDGNACNGVESCDPTSGCSAGVALDCDDHKPCTADACDPALGCTHVVNASCVLVVEVTPAAPAAGTAAATALGLDAPAGAVLQTTVVTATPTPEQMEQPVSQHEIAASSHRFEPDGQLFETPITVTLPILPGLVPPNVTVQGGEVVPVHQYDPVAKAWKPAALRDGTPIAATVSLDATTVSFATDHFTDYGFGEECIPECGNGICGDNGCGGSCGDCDDSDPCSIDTCINDGGLRHCEHSRQAVCTTATPCTVAAECDDHNPCTADLCAGGVCTYSWYKDGSACSVADACLGSGECRFGICAARTTTPLTCDTDWDGIVDEEDNCAAVPNPQQADTDRDGTGDACDDDIDADGVANAGDNCPYTPNPDQTDGDGDGNGDRCQGAVTWDLRRRHVALLPVPFSMFSGFGRVYASSVKGFTLVGGEWTTNPPPGLVEFNGEHWRISPLPQVAEAVFATMGSTLYYGGLPQNDTASSGSYFGSYAGQAIYRAENARSARRINEIPGLYFSAVKQLQADGGWLYVLAVVRDELWTTDRRLVVMRYNPEDESWEQVGPDVLANTSFPQPSMAVRAGQVYVYYGANIVRRLDQGASAWVDVPGESASVAGVAVAGGKVLMLGATVGASTGCGRELTETGTWAPLGTTPGTYPRKVFEGPAGVLYFLSDRFVHTWDGQECTLVALPRHLLGHGSPAAGAPMGNGDILLGLRPPATLGSPAATVMRLTSGGSLAHPHPAADFTLGYSTIDGVAARGQTIFAAVREPGTTQLGANLWLMVREGHAPWQIIADPLYATYGPQLRVLLPTSHGLYAAGRFDESPVVGADALLRLDGTSWTDLGVRGDVRQLKVAGGSLFISGDLMALPGLSTPAYLARQNLGSGSWEVILPKQPHPPYSLVFDVLPGRLVAAGEFVTAGGQQIRGVATWSSGTGWQPEPYVFDELPQDVRANAAGDLCFRGRFTQVEGITLELPPQATSSSVICRLGEAWVLPPAPTPPGVTWMSVRDREFLFFIASGDQQVVSWDGMRTRSLGVKSTGSEVFRPVAHGPEIITPNSGGGRFVTEAPYWPAEEDWDMDGATNAQEWAAGTDPFDPFTDADLVPDGVEIASGMNPLVPDTDGDGLVDGEDDCPLTPNQPSEAGPEACSDGEDNDCDGSADCMDPECANEPCGFPEIPGDACWRVGWCGNGTCISAGPISCNDFDGCTVDGCDSATGCTHTPIVCDDGNICTVDFCQSTGDTTHECMTTYAGLNNTPCVDDGDPCTSDYCMYGECLHQPDHGANGQPCDDGEPCTQSECLAGECKSTAVVSCDDGDPCTMDVCAPGTGCAPLACPTASGYSCGGAEPGCAAPSGELVLVPAGPFWMGCNPAFPLTCPADTQPYHEVTLSAFEIMRHEVTGAAYQSCVDAAACTQPLPTGMGTCPNDLVTAPDRPATCISHDAATVYCAWAGLRLCTEAEWEKAARGPDGRAYPTVTPTQQVTFDLIAVQDGSYVITIDGVPYEVVAAGMDGFALATALAAAIDPAPGVHAIAELAARVTVTADAAGGTFTHAGSVPAGAYGMSIIEREVMVCSQARLQGCGLDVVGTTVDGVSPYGGFDLLGNAAEWVADYYAPTTYATHSATDPTGPAGGSSYVVRGSHAESAFATTWNRASAPATSGPAYTGFRCCRSVP